MEKQNNNYHNYTCDTFLVIHLKHNFFGPFKTIPKTKNESFQIDDQNTKTN